MGRSTIEIDGVVAEAAGGRPGSPIAAAEARFVDLSGYARSLATIAVLALAARTVLLGSAPRFWGDEAFNAVQVRKPLLTMLEVVRHDSHPPLIYLLQSVVAIFSTSPFALRLVSALAGAAAVLAVAALGRRVGDDRAGLVAAGLLAAFPGYLLSSRDARGYSLAMFLVLAAALALWRAIESPTRSRLLIYGACVAGAVYTHYFTIPAVGAQLLVALWAFRPARETAMRLVAACAAGGLALLPWLLAATAQFEHAGASFWVAPVHFQTLLSDIAGRLGQTPVEKLTTILAWTCAAALVPLVALVYRHVDPGRRRGLLYLLYCALAPSAALLLVSLWKPVYDTRFILMFWGPGVAVVGASLAMIRWRWVAPAVCLALTVASVIGLMQIQRPDFAAVVSPLNGHLHAGDVVALNGPDHYFSVAYAGDAVTKRSLVVVADDVPWYFGTAGYPAGTQVRAIAAPTGRLYLVTDQGRPLPALPAGFQQVRESCRSQICVKEYSR